MPRPMKGHELAHWATCAAARHAACPTTESPLKSKKPPQSPAEPGLRRGLLLRGSGRSRTDDGGFAIGEPPPKSSEETEEIATGRGVSRGNSLAGTFHDGNIETLAAKWHLLSDDMRTAIMAIFYSTQTTTPEADQS